MFCARSALCCVQKCSVSRESAQYSRGRSSVSGLSRPVQDWPGHPRCSPVFPGLSRARQDQEAPGLYQPPQAQEKARRPSPAAQETVR